MRFKFIKIIMDILMDPPYPIGFKFIPQNNSPPPFGFRWYGISPEKFLTCNAYYSQV